MVQNPEVIQAKERAREFSRWFNTKVKPYLSGRYQLELDRWQRELELIHELLSNPNRLRIALVGTTGAGKSTFLNAILDQEVLPVSVMQPCTAFVTAVAYAPTANYKVEVEYLTRREWQRDLESLIGAMFPGEPDDDGDSQGESRRLIDAAKKRIYAVYGIPIEEDLDPLTILDRKLPDEAERVLGSDPTQEFHFHEAKGMITFLREHIRGESALWPLIKQVSIKGPYECLSGGLELIDLPGLNDPNEARVEITRHYLRTSPFVWVVFSMVRGLTEDIRRIFSEEKLLRTLVLNGNYGALSLIGTKADDIDVNIAPQLGLPEDCSTAELISAYRDKTASEARRQLEQMVRDLATKADEGETLNRMIQIAREIHVHATSASAYIRLKGFARLRRDYGIDDPEDTGIPGVHRHLEEIGCQAGASFNAQTAVRRLDQLTDEIVFFFRANSRVPTAQMEQARVEFQRERENFCRALRVAQTHATNRLRDQRDQFLQRLGPILEASTQGVQRATGGWQSINWATLRAIVHRDGCFRSPSTGRSYDFNEDLTAPLLTQLPVRWEQYFSDELGRVTDEFVLRVSASGRDFCEKIRLIIRIIFKRESEAGVEEQLNWFDQKVSLVSKAATGRVLSVVRERRSELASKIPVVARGMLQPAYDASKGERGKGMKRRILDILIPAANRSARPIYDTIQADLVEGLGDLEAVIIGMYAELAQTAEEQARIVAHNANIDAGDEDPELDPIVAEILETCPVST